jgi:hypothetical protein
MMVDMPSYERLRRATPAVARPKPAVGVDPPAQRCVVETDARGTTSW